MGWMAAAASMFGDLAGAWAGSNAQSGANKTNVKLQREQQKWEEMMSNTAVFRRAQDIERAGGNRALAFTGGQSASTPSVAPATVEPTFKPEWMKGMGATAGQLANQVAQLKLTNAQTQNIQAQTVGQNIKNNVNNAFAFQVAEVNLDLKTLQKQTGEKSYELLEQNIKNALATGENLALTGAKTAAETNQITKMTSALVAAATAQARKGQLEVEALENIAAAHGIEIDRATNIIKTIIEAVATWARRGR